MESMVFNNLNSYSDYGLVLTEKRIATPPKEKIKVKVPYMNSTYDFSTVGSNGEIIYNQRSIEVDFATISADKQLKQSKLTEINAWLLDAGKSQLIFSDIPDYYFLAEIEDGYDIKETFKYGKFTAKFIAEPFKVGVSLEGSSKEWDTFNFEEDYLQDSEFNVSGTQTITLYNAGRLVMPTINCSAAMTIVYNGKTYNLAIGDNSFYDFKFVNGANSIVINGTGHVKILFRKQVI